ncbi:acetyl-CoA C-acyltransferase [Caulobacter mirabilis]|uniref:Acetyl-CoA C-acyltransferase n=1 Tax=Caulobacter mirabilis TaxID=69666 RepID=A0A2D2B1J7_9CAUL|nr:acetyl-CoA C-acyltransferase [Caulobacter mirabilis]ATQ44134.1 acetyl-CoA C-acyltransferase [Caulobacter mirabilis]
MAARAKPEIWLASGVRTPFAKVDGPLAGADAIGLSVPVVRHMIGQLDGGKPDFAVWGAVAPNLTWSNIAREILMDAGFDATIPAFGTVMACSTSMIGAFEAAGLIDGEARNLALVGGVESMSRVQIGLGQKLSDWLRKFQQARTLSDKLNHLSSLKIGDVKLFIPSVTNRTSGMSMGEHTEITAQEWRIARVDQDAIALASHQKAVAGWEAGFFDDLVIPFGEVTRDVLPRKDTSAERLAKLPPAFDRTSGKGTLSAGNSTPLTDGAAGLWVASKAGLARLPAALPRVKLVDYEVTSVDFRTEGLLMAPAYGVPRMLARNGLTYEDIDLWEIHEAFAAQVLFHIKAWEDRSFLRDKAGVTADLGDFPRDRMNPHGGSIALGHPFGATGARILSQAVKELASRPKGSRAIVSICADGGQGTMALLENA